MRITCHGVIKEADLLENGWAAALGWVARKGGGIKLRVASEEEAAISSRTFQGVEHSRQGNNSCLNLCPAARRKP